MAGLNAFGTQLMRGDGSETDETFTAIANVFNVEGPGLTRNTIDVTAHDSTDGWMEFLGALKDAGELTLDINYDPSEHDTLVEDFEEDQPHNYQLVFPDTAGTTWQFAAILTEFPPAAPHDDKLTASLTFKATGKPDTAAGAT